MVVVELAEKRQAVAGVAAFAVSLLDVCVLGVWGWLG